ncbi:VRR-NUC domain-containing protein [Ferrovibrio terrae]|uniref:VRR-NUC domain-containing protein n=1 Tax=Ferrovibrio terrae TaxID=2594003 RepID=UPI00313818B5
MVWRFFEIALPIGCFAFHAANGGRRGRIEAAIFKGLGVVAGVPDFIIIWQGRVFGIELKADSGRLSMPQVRTHQAMTAAGCEIAVCRSLDEVDTALRGWGIPLLARFNTMAAA